MKLILITTPNLYPGETDAVNALFQAGLEILHLRKPGIHADALKQWLQAIDIDFRNRIVIHEHFELTEEFQLKGVHLNRRNPQAPDGFTGHISCSCHSLQEVAERKSHYTYVFLSPIYNSISKVSYKAAFTIDELKAATAQNIIDQRVIALGGIHKERLSQISSLGFGGAAILGDLWSHTDRDLIPYFQELKKEAYS
ncbi:thiamine monophosphate synthase/TENI [gut metagenome]|uniref:Thiamine monophosphate synthase/TENI n=1 Tax=gut metagenome TaxID=749906 RepID=J9H0L4_9ZZZZ